MKNTKQKVISINEGKHLKDFAYEIIKGAVDCDRDPKELLWELERQNAHARNLLVITNA